MPDVLGDGDHAHVDGVVDAAHGRRRERRACRRPSRSSFLACSSKIRIVPGLRGRRACRSTHLDHLLEARLVRRSSMPPIADLHRAACRDHLRPAAAALRRCSRARARRLRTISIDLLVVGDHRRRLAGRHLVEAADVDVARSSGWSPTRASCLHAVVDAVRQTSSAVTPAMAPPSRKVRRRCCDRLRKAIRKSWLMVSSLVRLHRA